MSLRSITPVPAVVSVKSPLLGADMVDPVNVKSPRLGPVIVIVSVPASVVMVILVPAANVNVSDEASATTLLCPATAMVLKRAGETQFEEQEDRVMEFSFSSEYPVERSFGSEVLSHDKNAADLSRLNDGAPLLFNHDTDLRS